MNPVLAFAVPNASVECAWSQDEQEMFRGSNVAEYGFSELARVQAIHVDEDLGGRKGMLIMKKCG